MSPDMRVRLCPRSDIMMRPQLFIEITSSNARGIKDSVFDSSIALYLMFFRSAAIPAAALGVPAVARRSRYEAAKVFMTVASHRLYSCVLLSRRLIR